MIEEDLQNILINSAAITSIVDDRIYAVIAPETLSNAPYIVYSRAISLPDAHLKGNSGLDQVRITIDCWAKKLETAKDLAQIVRSELAGTAIVKSDFDDYDSEEKYFRSSQDFQFWQS